MSKKAMKRNGRGQDFGELLREARTTAGMSVRDLSAATKKKRGPDVSITLISLLEKNKRVPTYKTAYVLGRALSTDVETVLDAAYNSRISHCIDRETEAVREFARAKRMKTSH